MAKNISQTIKEYFDNNPNREITQEEVVSHVFKFFPNARDPWRVTRKLYEEGYLVKVSRGVYKRIPGYQAQPVDAPFPDEVRQQIFERDNYRCVVCGNGLHNGYEIHADHIIPLSKDGKSILENGQTLCSEHNMMKKNYGTTDFLRRYSMKMLEIAREIGDNETEALFEEILKILDKHGY